MGSSEAMCTTPLEKKIGTSRLEILVVAFGTLLFVGQLCLALWVFAQPSALLRRKGTREITATSPSPSTRNSKTNSRRNGHFDNNDSPGSRQKVRRSSSRTGGSSQQQRLYHQGRSGHLDELEECGTTVRETWTEMCVVAAAIVKPLSPRSPRLNAADQAAIKEELTADNGGINAPSPTPIPTVVEDAEALAVLAPRRRI